VDFARIYQDEPEAYDRLVSAEDVDGVLLPALADLVDPAGARVVEVGVGTARIARQLVGAGAQVLGLDAALPMLGVARRRLEEQDPAARRWALVQGDLRALPVGDGWADLAVAGWVFGHQRFWEPGGWRAAIAEGVEEMRRVARPGAPVVLLETQGTGATEPTPPPEIAEVECYLAEELGFVGTTLRTDYAFADVAEAAATCGFFFGDEFAARVRAEGWARVPECTGMWVSR
jgi:ubiquinone/menaquinone biosynthesis C-methylase UbiE